MASPADGAYTVTGFNLNNVSIGGVNANFNPATGQLTISSATPFATTNNPLLLGNFTFLVPGLGNPGPAPLIDTKTPIDITVTSVLDAAGNPKPFLGVNGFHVSAYLGNVAAPIGVYTSTDVSQIQGLIISTVKAFALYPNVDPLLLADVNDDGTVNNIDVSQMQARILGLPSTIPAVPFGASGVAVNGADPVLFIGSTYTPNGQPASLGNLTPGSTVVVPLSVFVTDPHGANVTGTEAAFSFDPKVFALNGVTAGAIANGSLGGSLFVVTFNEAAPGELNVIGSSNLGPNLAYGQTATLFLVSLTVRANAPAGSTWFNLLSTDGSFQTGLLDNLGQNLVLSPAPSNVPGNNLDAAFTVQGGKGQQSQSTSIKHASSNLAPGAWEQLTAQLFGAAVNQQVLNTHLGLVGTTAVAVSTTESNKQSQFLESLQGSDWVQLTTNLFKNGNDTDLKGYPTI